MRNKMYGTLKAESIMNTHQGYSFPIPILGMY